jgi:orotidine-5'-phosphate decarboxylase
LVDSLGALAVRSGVDGLVCSAKEASVLRAAHGPKVFLCTPGIRPADGKADDQARVETPTAAIRAGSDLLVVGRPLYTAKDPVGAAARLVDEISRALA